MALFDRNDRNYGYRGGEMNRGRGFADQAGDAVRRGWDRVEGAFEGRGDYGRDYQGRGGMGASGDYRGMNRGMGNPSREREGLWANSWSDGAWTADAADRTDRDWHLGRGGGVYDRDIRPAEAGWRAGGMQGGGMHGGGMQGGMGGRGMTDRDRGWNLGGGDWGHNWGSGNPGGGGYRGMDRDDNRGGFVDRAQNAVRRGWDRVEETFDRDDDRHLGRGAMRGGTSWAGSYDRDFNGMRGDSGVRGYRDDEGHYGVIPAHNDDELARPGGGYGASGGMNRYGGDYRGSGMNRGGMGMGRYDNGYRGGRNWF